MPCSSRSSNSCRMQLEHDVSTNVYYYHEPYVNFVDLKQLQLCIQVRRLEQLLEEERYMRSVLENALEHAAVKLSDLSLLPNEVRLNNFIVYLCHLIENHNAIGPSPPLLTHSLIFPLSSQAQELLSHILTLETTITRLEEEFVSLHFQLIQERNERRLAEYRLKQVPLEALPLCSHPQPKIIDTTVCHFYYPAPSHALHNHLLGTITKIIYYFLMKLFLYFALRYPNFNL